MKPLSENVYAYSPEAKEFTAYPISILFLTEPWFGLGEGGTVFSTSLIAEDGHVTEPWPMKCTGSHLGFWENSLAAGLLLLLSGLPPLPSRNGGVALRVAHSSYNCKASPAKAERQKSSNICPGLLCEKIYFWFIEVTVYSGFFIMCSWTES